MAFIQAGIITLYSFGTYYEIRLAERLSHTSLLLSHIFIMISLENEKCSVWKEWSKQSILSKQKPGKE